MKNFLVVALGGTISSHITSKKIVELEAPKFNETFFQKIKGKINYKVISPVAYSSENASVEDYKTALKSIVQEVNTNKPDAILILHGTDTIHFFAQLAVRVLSYLNIPVVITGSKLPMDDSHSDAIKNLKLALGFLDAASEGQIGSATFGVVYSDSFMEDATFVPAGKIIAPNESGDYQMYKNGKKPEFSSKEYERKAKAFLESEKSKQILVVPAVPDFPYDAISVDGLDAVLIDAFHSGTQNINKLPDFINKCKSSKIDIFMSSPLSGKYKYDSRRILEDLKVKVLDGYPVEGAWAEILIG